jgi:hypothetical protein
VCVYCGCGMCKWAKDMKKEEVIGLSIKRRMIYSSYEFQLGGIPIIANPTHTKHLP